jgi:hypothetical protein
MTTVSPEDFRGNGGRPKLAVGAGEVHFHIPAVPLEGEYLADVTTRQRYPLVS